MSKHTRRTLLAGAAALVVAPALRAASSDDFAAARDAAGELDQLHSLTIAVDGETRLAEAPRGPGLDAVVNVMSVSKTLVATLAGIAIDRGELPGPDATLDDIAPGLIPTGADERVGTITMGDLMTMRAGLERTSGGNYGAWVESADWVADALSRPMVEAPGAAMQYSTGSYHVLGAVLKEVTGRSLHALANEWLAGPLGFRFDPWTRDPQGRYMGGNNMAMRPSELLRFGEMIRRGGAWDGTQVVSGEWILRAWMPRTESRFSGDQYGYGWFLREMDGHRAYYARGYGGQMLYVVPSLRLSVVITSDNGRPARSDGHQGDLNALVEEHVIPAAEALVS